MSIKLLTPYEGNIEVAELPAFTAEHYVLRPFDELTISFLDTYSKNILSDASINRVPEIAALGFWLRRANINNIKGENKHLFESITFISNPIGKVLHICPANVDTMFFYSFAVSMLMGNRNILRLSTRMDAPQIMALFTLLNKLIADDKFSIFRNYINIITYGHDDSVSEYLSEHVNARMIWGGDGTIGIFKQFKTAPRTKDIVFADRISLLCISCASYLSLDEKGLDNFAHLFLNDSYTFDQKGCSSPQTIYFLGNDAEYTCCINAMQNHLKQYVASRYETEIESLASIKLNQSVDDIIEHRIDKRYGDNYCTFVQLGDTVHETLLHSCGGGYFYVKRVASLAELSPVVNEKLQTISYFGLTDKELQQLQNLANDEGIDRVVPIGMAMNFHYIWDGYNLLDELSRKVFVK